MSKDHETLDSYGRYGKPVSLGHGVYWVGYHDRDAHLHCNPYLIVEGDQAVLIDGGSRGDFPVVMLKIMQAGVDPGALAALIYQHYDPDLCGSLPNLLDLCDNSKLRVLSARHNNAFIAFYCRADRKEHLVDVDHTGWEYNLGGRRLRFIHTPYAHSPGSFVTYDERSGILFSSDLFGSFATHWDLFIDLNPLCYECTTYDSCPAGRQHCPLPDIIDFHRKVFPCDRALHVAVERMRAVDPRVIAPQHGGILRRSEDINFLLEYFSRMTGVGIDGVE
jgi:flavorubredoxin